MHKIQGLHLAVKEGKTVIAIRDEKLLTPEQIEAVGKMNKTLDDATWEATSAGCLKIQNLLGIDAGDYAGVYFSGDEANEAVRQTMAKYLLAELRWAECHDEDDE